jgi:hypothetical protein
VAIRKFWIGTSNEDDHKPTDFETFLVDTKDELQDVQALVAEWMADDYFNSEGDENEND